MAKNTYSGIGDIKTGLLKKSVWKKAFWGKYENQIPSEVKEKNISDNLLLDLQIKKLKILESNEDFSEANQFIREASMTKAENLNNEILEKSSSQAYQRFIELLNAGLWSSELNPIKANRDYHGKEYREKRDAYIESLLVEITNLLSQLNVNGPNSKTIVKTLEKRLRTMKKDEFSIREYVRNKAFFAELVAAQQLSNKPGYKGLVTGNYLNQAGEQLIEDAFGFKNSNLSKKFSIGLVNFTIIFKTGEKAVKSAGSMKDFFEQIENIEGEYTIQLTNEMYDAMRQAASLKAQVKSGIKQDILNKAKERNAISLGEIGFFAEGLWELYFEDMAKDNNETWFKEQQYSKTLNTVLNYLLSKSIADTNIKRNEVYFSKDGILTASAWMKLNNRLLKFNPTINKLSISMLKGKYPYSFKGIE